jgi:type 1 glutamine amidotransferase
MFDSDNSCGEDSEMSDRCSRWIRVLFLAIAASISARSSADDPPGSPNHAKPIRALLVTGGCCHDFEGQTAVLCQRLRVPGDERSIDWTVHTYGDSREIEADIYKQPQWASGFDVVVHNECFGGVRDAAFVESIVAEHVRAKVPAVVLHCSMHSYRLAPTDRWREFVGVTSRRHEQAKRPLSVRFTEPDDPIVAAIAAPWQTPTEELYIIEKVWPAAEVLATAFSEEEQAEQAVVWRNEYQGVSVFGTTLGHYTATVADPIWLDLVGRGLAWAMSEQSRLQSVAPGE